MCQDKIYFLDGTTKTGKVTDINNETIIIASSTETASIPRSSVLLIHYLNGDFEKMNAPEKNVTIISDKKENFHFKQEKTKVYNYNLVSFNSVALCNADVAVFYERALPQKKIGLGVMGAYNFNLHANATNAYIAFLANAKKNYDLGAFINFYPTRFEKRTYMHFGAMLKYTSFDYSSLREDTAKAGNLISVTSNYTPAKGSQLATILTFGTHSNLQKNFFIKTIFGIGAFKLKGDYKKQYTTELNRNSTDPPVTINFLPKFYVGLNLGFKL